MQHFIRALTFIGLLIVTMQVHSASSDDEITRLVKIISQQDDTREKVECLVLLSQYYRHINTDSSLLLCERALELSTRIGYQEGVADALYKKSLTLKSMGDFVEALNYGQRFLSICDSLQDSTRLAKANFNMGNLKRNSSYKKPALLYYKNALAIYKNSHDTSALIAVYNSLGNFFQEIAVYDSSAIYYHKAIYYSEILGREKSLGRIVGNLGKVYRKLGDYDNAHKYLNMSLELDIKNEDLYNLPTTYSRLGNLAFEENNHEVAQEYYTLADSVYKLTGDALGIHNNYINQAYLLINQGKYKAALAKQKKALSFYREQDYSEGMIAAWQGMASVYSEMLLTEKALVYYDSCMLLANNIQDLKRQKEVLENIFHIYSQSGNYESALLTYTHFQHINDSIFNLEKTEIINNLLLKYEKEKDQLKILNLENENLKRVKQRNLLFFIGMGVVIIALLMIFFLAYKSRKNRIIADHKIKQLEEEKKYMAARFLVEGQEQERKRVALELHDNLGVLLSVTKMQFTAIRDKSPDNKALINKATKFLEQASSDVRKISHNLMPGLLTKLGLFEALEDFFETLDEANDIDAKIGVVGPKERLPENTEIMIYRMVQEMVNNTIKHAEADKIDLTLIIQPDEMNISYSDNGKGFDVKEILSRKTMGVQSIRSRVKFLDGIINIDSSPGNGTVYRICIPLGSDLPESFRHTSL